MLLDLLEDDERSDEALALLEGVESLSPGDRIRKAALLWALTPDLPTNGAPWRGLTMIDLLHGRLERAAEIAAGFADHRELSPQIRRLLMEQEVEIARRMERLKELLAYPSCFRSMFRRAA